MNDQTNTDAAHEILEAAFPPIVLGAATEAIAPAPEPNGYKLAQEHLATLNADFHQKIDPSLYDDLETLLSAQDHCSYEWTLENLAALGRHLPSVAGAIPHVWSHLVAGLYPDGGANCAVCDASLDAGYIGARPTTLTVCPPDADAAALAAGSRRLNALALADLDTLTAIQRPFEATLTEEQRKVYREIESQRNEFFTLSADVWVQELARHFPGLAPAITAVWLHVNETSNEPGTCCTPEAE